MSGGHCHQIILTRAFFYKLVRQDFSLFQNNIKSCCSVHRLMPECPAMGEVVFMYYTMQTKEDLVHWRTILLTIEAAHLVQST